MARHEEVKVSVINRIDGRATSASIVSASVEVVTIFVVPAFSPGNGFGSGPDSKITSRVGSKVAERSASKIVFRSCMTR